MKDGIGTRNKDFDSNADDSTPDELYADELELIPDEVNPDRPNTDDPNPDNQEDSNATVEGEQQRDNSVADLHQQSGNTSSENQVSANPDDTSGNISGEVLNLGGASNSSSDSSKDWVTAIQEELNAFERNEDWKLMAWHS